MIIESSKNLWSELLEFHPQKGNIPKIEKSWKFNVFLEFFGQKIAYEKKIELNETPVGIPDEMAKSDFF